MAQDSLADVAAFGHRLGLSLQIFLEGSSGTGKYENLPLTILHVNSTASSLLQIQDTLDKDRDAASPIFQEAGRREIDRLAAQCKRIYLVIVLVLHRAAESHCEERGKLELPEDGFKDVPLSIAKLGVRCGLDLSWLKPRVRQFGRELQRVKCDLLLLLLLGTIAQCQLRHSTRAPGSFEEEQALRALAETMTKRRTKFAEGIAERRSKAFEAAKEASSAASSVDDDASSTVTTSTSTAVDPHAPIEVVRIDHDLPGKCPLAGAAQTALPDAAGGKNGVIQRFLSEPNPDAPQPKTLADPGLKPQASEDKLSDKNEEEPKEDKDTKVENPNGNPSSVKSQEKPSSHMMPSWIRQILSNKPRVDWENEDLEAALLELTVSFDDKSKQRLTKLEMDDEGVKSAVAKLTSRSRFKRRPRLLEQYKLLDPRVRHQVDEAITAVKQWGSRSKEWVAIEVVEEVAERGRSQVLDISVMLFFRLGQDVEPVRLDVGRELLLPFEHCRTWESTQSILLKLLWEENIRQRVQAGRYDLRLADGATISPEAWPSTVRPGMDVKLKPWPQILPPHMRPRGMWPHGPIGRVPQMPMRPTVINVSPPPSLPSTPSVPEKSKAEKKVEIMQEMDELLGIETDSTREKDVPKVGLGELLGMWTNAPDTHVEEDSGSDPSDFLNPSNSSSDSDSSSGSGSDSSF